MSRSDAFLWMIGLALGFGDLTQRPAQPPPPTFYKDVLPILQNHCQNCHRLREVAPMPFVTYQQTKPWATSIAHATEMKMMPPWFADPRYGRFANDPSLSDYEIHTLSAWAQNGALAGDPHDAPSPKAWTDGWNIPNPDLVVKMPKPVPIPAHDDSVFPLRNSVSPGRKVFAAIALQPTAWRAVAEVGRRKSGLARTSSCRAFDGNGPPAPLYRTKQMPPASLHLAAGPQSPD